MTGEPQKLPPIHRSVSVSWEPAAAFDRFTTDFAKWWPKKTHSIGGPRVKRVVFECREGGRIYEEHDDGTRFLWGTVTAFDPPDRVAFMWHASYDAEDAQEVEVTFTPESTGTRVDLVSSGWEKMGDHARRSYGGYKLNWQSSLGVYAGRSTRSLLMFKVICFLIDATRQRGNFIRNSKGRMSA